MFWTPFQSVHYIQQQWHEVKKKNTAKEKALLWKREWQPLGGSQIRKPLVVQKMFAFTVGRDNVPVSPHPK
jgi:hypothetical protein